ncbi:MAG: MFS transporter, partial [archaeon]|nr:MFS transporter [archaeon]
MSNIYRSFGVLSERSTFMLGILSKVYAATSCICRFLWGFIFDKIGFFVPFLICSSIQTLSSAAFFFTRNSNPLYFIINIICVLSSSGSASMFGALIGKIFGVKNSSKLVGITCIGMGIMAILAPILINSFVHDNSDYLLIFIIDASLGVMAIVLVFLIWDDDKFDYNLDTDLLKEKEEDARV